MTKRWQIRGFVALLALLGLFASPAYAAPPEAPPGLARAKELHERHSHHLFSFPGVVGTGVGLPSEDAASVKIFVERADMPGLPRFLEEVPVEVVVTGRIFALRDLCAAPPSRRPNFCDEPSEPVDATVRFDHPVPIGVSTGHPAVTAGTICCRVRNASDVFVMSNNHIFADTNEALLDDPVLQPGRIDGGNVPEDEIATLYDFEPIAFDGSDNIIDAAIALTTLDEVDNRTPSDGYGSHSSATAVARPRMRVMKYGRTTGLTRGRIVAVDVTVDVVYPEGVARFVQQILIEGDGFVAPGDSGSLVVTDRGRSTPKPVGLLFAGSYTHTVANPIDLVLDLFGVAIDGERTHMPFRSFRRSMHRN